MDSLPDGWVFVEDHEQTSNEFVQEIDQDVEGIYLQPEYEVGLFLLPNSAQTILLCRSSIHRWLVENSPGTDDETAREFIKQFERRIPNEDGQIEPLIIQSATFESLKASPYRPAPPVEEDSADTLQSEVERFFDGYIPGGTIGPLPHYGPALSCPPPTHSDGHSEAREEISDAKFHLVWTGHCGFVVGWYCPECDPQSLQEVERGWIPFSEEWEEIMNQTEAEMGTIGSAIWMGTRPDTQLESDDPIRDAITVDVLEDYFKSPEKWEFFAGVPLWPGTTHLLVNCDLAKVETSSRHTGEGELVMRQPRIIDQEEHTFPWSRRE